MALTERLAIVLETVGSSAAAREFQKVGGAAGGLSDKLNSTSGFLRQFGLAGQQAGGALSGALTTGLVAAGTAVLAFGVNSVKTYTELAQSVLAFQRASGASAEEASALIAAFDDMGIAAEVGTKAIFQLGKRLAENSEKLRDVGVTAAYGASGNVDLSQTLLNVADAYKATEDPAARAQLLTAAFGKTGQALIPILEQGRAGIEAMYAGAERTGQILSQEDIDRAEEFRLAMDELGDAVRSLSIAAGQHLVPAITKAVDILTTLIDRGRDVGDLPIVGWALQRTAKTIDNAFTLLGSSSHDAATAQRELEESTRETTQAIEEQERATDDLNESLLGAMAAQRAYDAAARQVEASDRTLVKSRADLNQLLKEGAVDEEKVADARRSLADATRSVNSAQRSLSRAQEEYNEALAAANILGTDTARDKLRDATDSLADAQDGLAGAQERQKDAQQDLARAQAGDPEFNDKLAAAKQKVKDAEQGLADAQFNSAKQAYELDEALSEQNTLLGENAVAVSQIRSEWDALLKRKPEIAAFLAGPLAALGPVLPSTTAPSTSPHFLQQRGEGPSWATPTGTAPTSGGGAAGTVKRIGDVIINITEAVTDPADLARKIIWSLN